MCVCLLGGWGFEYTGVIQLSTYDMTAAAATATVITTQPACALLGLLVLHTPHNSQQSHTNSYFASRSTCLTAPASSFADYPPPYVCGTQQVPATCVCGGLQAPAVDD